MSRKDYLKLDTDVFNIIDARNARLKKSYQDILPSIREYYDIIESKWGVGGEITFADITKYNRFEQIVVEMNSVANALISTAMADITEDLGGVYTLSYNTNKGIIEKTTGRELKASLKLDAIEKALKTPVGGLTFDFRMERVKADLTTKLTQTVTSGIENGKNWSGIAKDLRSEGGKNLSTLQRIVATEGHRLEEEAKFNSASSSPVELLKTWETEKDSRVRDSHSMMQGVTIGIDEEFTTPSGGHGKYPGDMGTAEDDINCRCFLSYKEKG